MSTDRLPRDEQSLLGSLLKAGDRDEPSPRVLHKTLAAVGVATTVSGATAAASASSTGIIAVVKWLTVGVIAGTSVMVGGGEIVERTTQARRAPESHAAIVTPPRTTESNPTVGVPAAMPTAVESTSALVVRPPTEAKPTTSREAPATPSNSAPTGTLGAEAALIERAASAVRAGNGTSALDALREYHSRFPRGRMHPEASVLEVQALVLQRQREAARDAA